MHVVLLLMAVHAIAGRVHSSMSSLVTAAEKSADVAPFGALRRPKDLADFADFADTHLYADASRAIRRSTQDDADDLVYALSPVA